MTVNVAVAIRVAPVSLVAVDAAFKVVWILVPIHIVVGAAVVIEAAILVAMSVTVVIDLVLRDAVVVDAEDRVPVAIYVRAKVVGKLDVVARVVDGG